MVKSSAATDVTLPGPRDAEPQPAAAPPAESYADWGQPVDDLPPLIEPIGFDEPDAGVPPSDQAPLPGYLVRLEQGAETAPPAADEPVEPDVGVSEPKRRARAPASVEIAPPAADEKPVASVAGVSKPKRRSRSQASLEVAPPVADAPIEPAVGGTEPKRGERFSAWRDRSQTSVETAPPAADPLPKPAVGAAAPKRHERFSAWRGRSWGSLARWQETALAALPSTRRQRIAVGAGAVGLLIVAVVVAAGLGALSRVRDYRASPPPKDPAERFSYYQGGAKSGDATAELELAILYAKGEGVTQDYAAAASWFRAAADQGVVRAQYDLGVLYERGRGVPVDLNEAASWYLKSATGRYPLAEYNLAVCYTKGQGIRQDLPEAALWYRRSAGHGVVLAMVNLGTMLEKGDGVAASPVDAYAWYLAAGQRGNQTAAQRAQELFTSLPRLDQIRAEALASDVAASIRNPEMERGEAAPEKPDAKSSAPDR